MGRLANKASILASIIAPPYNVDPAEFLSHNSSNGKLSSVTFLLLGILATEDFPPFVYMSISRLWKARSATPPDWR